MRDIKKDIANYRAKRKSRMDERKARFDFEVGVYPPDETGDKEGHGNTRLPYGLCKAAGIDTEGMTPADAWSALEDKTGIKADKAYDKLEKDGDAKKLAKETEKLAKKKPKKKKEEPEGEAGTEEFIEPVVTAPDKPVAALTPTTFKSTISSLSSTSHSVKDFAKAIEKEIMPRIKKGQTLDAGGHSYYCNGEGFETEKGEERTKAFVAYRLAKYAKESGSSLSLKTESSLHSSKESEKAAMKSAAATQFRNAMMAARNTVMSGVTHAAGKCAKHVELVLDELPIGSKVNYVLVNSDGTTGKKATVEKVGDNQYYLNNGTKKNAEQVSWYLTRNLEVSSIPSLEADDLSLPSALLTTGGYKGVPESVSMAKTAPSAMAHTKVSPATKAALKPGTPITVKKTASDAGNTPTMKFGSKARSLWRAVNSKLFKSSDVKAVESGMKRLMDENEFCMSRSGNTLKMILETGFKNQIEVLEGDGTSDSISYANPDERRKASQRLFGTPLDTKADSYEKYGFLGNPWSYDGDYGSTYGDVTLVFDKDKIKNRTTYTLGDSLGPAVNRGMVAGQVGNNPTFEGWYLSRPKAKALDMLKNGASLSEILSFTKNAYLELQFHGELTMSDVKYIVFKSESAYKNYVTAEIQKAFDDLGIEVSIK